MWGGGCKVSTSCNSKCKTKGYWRQATRLARRKTIALGLGHFTIGDGWYAEESTTSATTRVFETTIIAL